MIWLNPVASVRLLNADCCVDITSLLIVAVVAELILPCAFTVSTGIAVAEP